MVIVASKSCLLYRRYFYLIRSFIWTFCPCCWSRNKDSSCLNKPASSYRGKHLISCWFLCTFKRSVCWIKLWNNCISAKYSGVCYNDRMLQRTVFINKIRVLKRTQMLQRTRRNTIGRRSMRVRTSQAFPLWLERQSSLLSFVSFSYQFSSVICLFAPSAVKFFSTTNYIRSNTPHRTCCREPQWWVCRWDYIRMESGNTTWRHDFI
jgi:hypothetical protein